MRKNILFVIDSLDCAGAEKSLVSLLNFLDYEKLSVDLMLFSHGNMLEELLPKEVNILKPLSYSNFAKLNHFHSIKYLLSNFKTDMFISRYKYSLKIRRRKYRNSEKARIYWECVSNVIDENNKKYDYAISYAQGIPTFYVAEKVKAEKKYAWVNVSYKLKGKDKEFQKYYYDKYNKIIAVSDSTKDIFLETFPDYKSKVEVIYDINNYELISNMADIEKGFEEEISGIRLLTIGRLANQKGYDIALNACKILKEKGVNFKWYVLGKGPLQAEIEEYIKSNRLENHFVLLGVKANPYPYIKNSDIYVQTSKFEGFGLAIAESRMLNVPVVTTRFDAVYNQMVNEKNGLVVDMNAEAVADGIMRLIEDERLKQNIVKYLKTEKKGNVEELDKFHKLIG